MFLMCISVLKFSHDDDDDDDGNEYCFMHSSEICDTAIMKLVISDYLSLVFKCGNNTICS